MLKRATLLVFAFALFAASASAQQDDPWLGTWKVNIAKSKYDPGPVPTTASTTKREALPGGQFKTTTDGVNAQGQKTHTEFTFKPDGKDYPITGDQNFDIQSVRNFGTNTRVVVSKKNGQVVRMIRTVLSPDGKSYTNSTISINAQGQVSHNIQVYEKQ